MAKKALINYVCQSCGHSHRKWVGKCEGCGEYNSVVEEAAPDVTPKGMQPGRARNISFQSLNSEIPDPPRQKTGISEFDRVSGGGLVPGSALLIGGDPGIGKSTLLLQVVAALSRQTRTLYISGEEASEQIRLRARRLDLAECDVELAATNNVRDIVAALEKVEPGSVAVIDSIQTMFVDNIDSAPGSVSQVRASTHELIKLAKTNGITVIIVGHVTKDGQIAGPRVLEHMVDTVLYFEGERGHQFRLLRAVKNRFGAANEIGVFEMTGRGLAEVTNPSELFITNRQAPVSGTVVFPGLEGSRPMLVEIEALVAPSPLATPRRAVVGWDSGRLAMVLAVLEARCGVSMSGYDVYLNVAGGMRINEPAADLAVATALVSALTGEPIKPGTTVFGEIALSGEIRPVGQSEARLKEAAKLGFKAAILPKGTKNLPGDLQLMKVDELYEMVTRYTPDKPKQEMA